MIKVFGATDTVFTSNGDIVIQPLKARVHREAIDYYIDIEVPIEYIDYMAQDRIVVVDTPQGEQAFRINNLTVTGKKISARCWHVMFDSQRFFFAEAAGNVTGSPATIMSQINHNIRPASPFLFQSGITEQKTVLVYFDMLYDVIMAVVEKFGCYIQVNNYIVNFQAIGVDRGVVIQYGKNLKDISCEEDWSEVCTRVYPFGASGITVDSTSVGLDVPYIDSSTHYSRRYIKEVEFDQSEIKRSSYPSQTAYEQALVTDLIAKGEAYLEAHALPKMSYNVKASIDGIANIGDTIVIIDERLGVELETHVTAFDYDCLTGKFSDITFGNYTRTAKGMGLTVNGLANNQQNGILAEKRLLFKDDNSLAWEYITPQP